MTKGKKLDASVRRRIARSPLETIGAEAPPRSFIRAIETFGKRVSAGMAVARHTSKPKQDVVEHVAKEFGWSERYVWGTVKLGARINANIITYLTKEAARKKHRSPRDIAGLFLIQQLRGGPQSVAYITALARKAGIADRTLRRERVRLKVKSRHIGGRNGHWEWHLSATTKKIFGIDG
jgi:hypothetical protein